MDSADKKIIEEWKEELIRLDERAQILFAKMKQLFIDVEQIEKRARARMRKILEE